MATQFKVSVVYAKSSKLITAERIDVTQEGNLTEIICLYPKISGKTFFISNYKKFKQYNNAYSKCIIIAKQQGKIDIVHLHVIYPAAIPTLQFIKQHPHINVFVSEHWSGYTSEDNSYKGLLSCYYTNKIISKAKQIFVVSNYLKQAMLNRGLKGNYTVLANLIDTNIFNIKKELQTQNKQINFVHISSLVDREKNITGILTAFKMALKTNTNLYLNIVSSSNAIENIMPLIYQLNLLNYVSFYKDVSTMEVSKIINQSQSLIMFSNFETFSIVTLEALACGKPVITTSVGGIKEYLLPELGITVEVSNVMQLSNAILKMTETYHSYSPELLRNFVLNNFDKNKILNTLSNHYLQSFV